MRPLGIRDETVLTAAEIARATRWHRFLLPGYRGITSARTRSGIDNVRLKYENANRLLATVVLNGITQDEDNNRGRPNIAVNPGPLVTIDTPGTKISKRQLRQNVPIFEEHTVDPDLLAEGTSNLRDYFQAQGYFDVEVKFQRRQVNNGATEIDYVIERGRRHRFIYLSITGNKYFDQKTIRERIYLTPKSFEFRRGRYSEAFDAARHEHDQGSLSVERIPRRRGHGPRRGRLQRPDRRFAVFFTITEGPQYYVARLDIQGAKKLDLTKTIESLSSQTGQAFSEYNVAADRETMIQQYGANGFPNATFEWSSSPVPGAYTVNLEFVINEGEKQFVREVVTTGLHTTRPQPGQETNRVESGRSAFAGNDGGYPAAALRSRYFCAGGYGRAKSGGRRKTGNTFSTIWRRPPIFAHHRLRR